MMCWRVQLFLYAMTATHVWIAASEARTLGKLYQRTANVALRCPVLDPISDRDIIGCLVTCTSNATCYGLNVYVSTSGTSSYALCHGYGTDSIRMTSLDRAVAIYLTQISTESSDATSK